MKEMKILVVDNNPVILKYMTDMLEKEGHQVLTAESGLEAVDILKTFTPEVIFTDLIMPNIDGEKFCQIIRKDDRLKKSFLVILSAATAENGESLTQMGANLCIGKTSFDKMGKYIRVALQEAERRNGYTEKCEILGMAESHPRQITKELLSDRRHFEVILDSIEEGILEVTHQGRIIYGNPSAIDIFGMTKENLLASDLIDLFDVKDQDRIRGLLNTSPTSPRRSNGAPPFRLGGKEVSVHLIPILDEENRTSILLLNDVSERKKMEAQFLKAQKMEAIGTLAGGIAHDFNNLLMVVKGYVSLMLLDMDPVHPHFEMLKTIEKKAEMGSRLTRQLLGYARKGRYEIKPILLNQLVEETAETLGRTRKDIVVHLDLRRDLHLIEGDPGQIEQVLMNLLLNAADAMPEGGKLFLKTSNVTQADIQSDLYVVTPGNYVLFSVTDTGIGMDEKTMERIFDPFFTTKAPGKGTGLGLASVYGIVKGHSGYINVQSELGKGATFYVYLPASEERKIEDRPTKSEMVLPGKETILLVDDEKPILDVGERMLKTLGYQVLVAEGGKQAIEIYQSHQGQIDLVILDLIMPYQGGGETFDHLIKLNSKVKVLLSSGYSMNGQAIDIMKKGCKGFIQKPFSIKELSLKLREILDYEKH